MQVLRRDARVSANSKLVVVSAGQRLHEQPDLSGPTDAIGGEHIHAGDGRVVATLKPATRTPNDGSMTDEASLVTAMVLDRSWSSAGCRPWSPMTDR